MNVRKIGQAALVVLAASSLASAASGTALAAGPGASVRGGESGLDAAQQNTAQAHRQNNSCNNPNTNSLLGSDVTGSRQTGRCATGDISRNNRSVVRKAPAEVEGGDGQGSLAQQNTAQQGRQNNNCNNTNNSFSRLLEDSEVTHRCTDLDGSLNNRTFTEGGGAHTRGGDSGVAFTEQNAAQEGRQNNNCNNPNDSFGDLTNSRVESECTHLDRSLNNRTVKKGGGAEAVGGTTPAALSQQNTAQEGRQNNNCNNPNASEFDLTGSQAEHECATVDRSLNNRTVDKSGGARAVGGDGLGTLHQQNTAQDGLQNNNCGNPDSETLTLTGSQSSGGCFAYNASRNNRSSFE